MTTTAANQNLSPDEQRIVAAGTINSMSDLSATARCVGIALLGSADELQSFHRLVYVGGMLDLDTLTVALAENELEDAGIIATGNDWLAINWPLLLGTGIKSHT